MNHEEVNEKSRRKVSGGKKVRCIVQIETSTGPKPAPVVEPVKVMTKPKGMKVDSAEIKKLEKGHFFVVVTCNGQRHEIEKRFKSTTKAQEWISKHEYVEL